MADRHETVARYALEESLIDAPYAAEYDFIERAIPSVASALRRVENAERERCAKIGDKGARLGWTAQSVANEIRTK
jgi:hypothetical protein